MYPYFNVGDRWGGHESDIHVELYQKLYEKRVPINLHTPAMSKMLSFYFSSAVRDIIS